MSPSVFWDVRITVSGRMFGQFLTRLGRTIFDVNGMQRSCSLEHRSAKEFFERNSVQCRRHNDQSQIIANELLYPPQHAQYQICVE